MERAALVGWAMSGLMLCGVSAGAQVINPRLVEFAPSPDHWAVVQGTDVLTDYSLQVFAFLASTPSAEVVLGKPDPDPTSGAIRLDVGFTLYYRTALPNGSYDARVAARGPAGTTVSERSNVFNLNRTMPYRPSPPVAVVVGAP